MPAANKSSSRQPTQTMDFQCAKTCSTASFTPKKAGKKGEPKVRTVSDITYLRTSDGWVNLTAVIDLFNRNVIGWALSADMETVHTTISALEMAFKNCKPQDGLLFHSDRWVQYCVKSFRDILCKLCPRTYGSTVRQSMSRKGNCWDNACAESFFKTLKTELETLDGKHSAAGVRQSVFMYIEAYYNRVRLHSVLDYKAPNEYSKTIVA
jgi:transposase InsO family protein